MAQDRIDGKAISLFSGVVMSTEKALPLRSVPFEVPLTKLKSSPDSKILPISTVMVRLQFQRIVQALPLIAFPFVTVCVNELAEFLVIEKVPSYLIPLT